ncbi:ANM_HP_G0080860.mRNA.1.CDS.1 [Saccharomyces cerevisiae]|nr:ANM_HP_G0178660.mRNA.1.CDS.1 [Saccharomyces cerevisiae]CAI5024090.1 ANM_HP_G0183960.mRNA.1.CDS.1 [Saccharomyces cerevisiae]CAI5213883.1 ANM_HP_G0013970.mRNA.1.CDS.1 [Saccharomyces cerevisiae]CAI5216668.1 ANM_HP_G0022460.mRNA.1.CDS.1 [Saccharomyces cerevisiae]CAI5223442.1 ANM_HP_G0054690.mRNA.1.CDS.1 [Saccharomyces cerevisiae]
MIMLRIPTRSYCSPSKLIKCVGLSPLKKSLLSKKIKEDIHPSLPVRTRFAPSPTGFLHLGSLRTALYNYLLARNTNGQFLLRLEDTDQKRLIEGAEENIYEILKWCNINYDETPIKQSERKLIYDKYVKILLSSGKAYRCFCSKERLNDLRHSAMELKPPSMASYDRCCAHLGEEEIKSKLVQGIPFTVRFKSPERYPTFTDLLHGQINLQPQVNFNDKRYDDLILVKSDKLPTYHLANVVDDHLMGITHVIRGEEWLPSTPKHIALYNAFGWACPKFIHIPLLTTVGDKKLSKRKGDMSISDLKRQGVLPEALINFCALFGWSPPRDLASKKHECFSMEELETIFNLNGLTKGNAKVDDKKLWFFNKHFLQKRILNPSTLRELVDDIMPSLESIYNTSTISREKVAKILLNCGGSLSRINDFHDEFYYFFEKPKYNDNDAVTKFLSKNESRHIAHLLKKLGQFQEGTDAQEVESMVETMYYENGFSRKVTYQAMRFALAGCHPGAKIAAMIDILGIKESNKRLSEGLQFLQREKK